MTTELDQVKQALRITREKLAEREELCELLLKRVYLSQTFVCAWATHYTILHALDGIHPAHSHEIHENEEAMKKARTQLGE